MSGNSDLRDDPSLPSPCYLVDEGILERNLAVLRSVSQRTGARILLALKGFAMHRVFPLLRRGLSGTAASSVDEALLGRRHFGGELHACAPAWSGRDIEALLPLADHLVFNSLTQWRRHGRRASGRGVSVGLRINPEHSEVLTPLYDPCAPDSRLGILAGELEGEDLAGVDGLHFHTMCEQGSDTLERTLAAVEERFGRWLPGMEWINFGGGHHITREDYDRDRLCRLIGDWTRRHSLQVYLEPGEAVALDAGILAGTVLDVVGRKVPQVILDLSATAHMPDVLEMPYRPDVRGAGRPGEKAWTCRLGGNTCLAGDSIGEYSFDRPLEIGDRVVFEDMAHYTMVKNTQFNGVRLPAIVLQRRDGTREVVRRFGFEHYRDRLS